MREERREEREERRENRVESRLMREHSVEGRDKADATEVCVHSFLQFYTGPRMVPHRVEAVGERIRWFDAKFEGLSAPSDPTHEQQ